MVKRSERSQPRHLLQSQKRQHRQRVRHPDPEAHHQGAHGPDVHSQGRHGRLLHVQRVGRLCVQVPPEVHDERHGRCQCNSRTADRVLGYGPAVQPKISEGCTTGAVGRTLAMATCVRDLCPASRRVFWGINSDSICRKCIHPNFPEIACVLLLRS